MTTQALRERGVVDALGLGALIGGYENPPTSMVEIGVDMSYPILDIFGLKEKPITGEMKGRNLTIIGSFKRVRCVL